MECCSVGAMTMSGWGILLLLLSASQAALMGPYDIRVLDMGDCASTVVTLDGTGSFRLVGRVHHNKSFNGFVYTGNLTVKDNVCHRGMTTLKMNFAKWDAVSGWRPNFLTFNFGDFCFFAEEIAVDLIQHLHKHIPDVPPKCPLRNGYYDIRNVPAVFGSLSKFPTLPYGKFRADILAFHSKEKNRKAPFFCLSLVLLITEKGTSL